MENKMGILNMKMKMIMTYDNHGHPKKFLGGQKPC